MEFQETKLKDVKLIKPQVFGDHRGFFLESYSKKKFQEVGIENEFVQDNHSKSEKKGVLRGLHFQKPPHAQAKLVRVTKGSVYDVIVDLRKNSPTYGRWQGFELSEKNFLMLFVPKGFAHAFCTLEPETEFLYKVDDFYAPECDSGIVWNDPGLAIEWPVEDPILSEKDQELPAWKKLENPF
ncbi:MAG: dTDP-4-dehydrorhamnose 3,5-epimerase [Candidatus Moranbacteria bacterium]|nr:dTDP-4-dehydrorhamnose 3,5-epimerase [Candidatus Moranbacteria bacterium]